MPVTLPFGEGEEELRNLCPYGRGARWKWLEYRSPTNQKSLMVSSMRVVHQMIKGQMACYYGLKIIKDLGIACI